MVSQKLYRNTLITAQSKLIQNLYRCCFHCWYFSVDKCFLIVLCVKSAFSFQEVINNSSNNNFIKKQGNAVYIKHTHCLHLAKAI